MALDPYSPCPCGTGKKIKFCDCAKDMLGDMERVITLLDAGAPLPSGGVGAILGPRSSSGRGRSRSEPGCSAISPAPPAREPRALLSEIGVGSHSPA